MAISALRQTPAVVRLTVLRDESQFKDEGNIETLSRGNVIPCVVQCSLPHKLLRISISNVRKIWRGGRTIRWNLLI